MKAVIGAMLAMFIVLVPLGGVWGMIFTPMVGGGIEQSFIYPLYGGMIVLSGLIVGCTKIIVEEIGFKSQQTNTITEDKPKG